MCVCVRARGHACVIGCIAVSQMEAGNVRFHEKPHGRIYGVIANKQDRKMKESQEFPG